MACPAYSWQFEVFVWHLCGMSIIMRLNFHFLGLMMGEYVLQSHTTERFLLLYGKAFSFQHVREIFKPIGEGFSGTLKDIQHILVPFLAKFMDIRAISIQIKAIMFNLVLFSFICGHIQCISITS